MRILVIATSFDTEKNLNTGTLMYHKNTDIVKITLLVIYGLRAYIHRYLHESDFKKPGAHWPAACTLLG